MGAIAQVRKSKPVSIFEAVEVINAVVMWKSPENHEHISRLRLQDPICLTRETDNSVHGNAVSVHDEAGGLLGYLMRELADIIAPFMDVARCTLPGKVIGLESDSSGQQLRLKICFEVPDYWLRIHPYPEQRYFQDIDYYYWQDPIRGNVKIFVNCSERVFKRIKAAFSVSHFKLIEQDSGLSLRHPLGKPPYPWALHFHEDCEVTEADITAFFKKRFMIVSAHDRIETISKEIQQYEQKLSVLQESLRENEELVSMSDRIDQQRVQEIAQREKAIAQYEHERRKLLAEKQQLKHELKQAHAHTSLIDTSSDKQLLNTLSALLCETLNEKLTSKELLQLVEELFPNRITVLPTALKSADRLGRFKYNRKLARLLWDLATKLWENFSSKTDMDPHAVFNGTYAHNEAQWGNNPVCKKARTFNYHGEELLMLEHLKITPDQYRLHFKWIENEHVIVVGHCGEHLPHK